MTTKIDLARITIAADQAAAAVTNLQTQAAAASHVEFLALLPLIGRAVELQRDISALAAAIEHDVTEGA